MRTRKDTMAYFFFFSVILAAYFHIALSGNAHAWSNDPTVNTPICTATDNQCYPQITSDGSGGTIITWEDWRPEAYSDIYAQRVNAFGAPQWGTNGVAACTADDWQKFPRITTDGSGGAIITWMDLRTGSYYIYAQKVDSSGTRQWGYWGVTICTGGNGQYNPQITTDGSGGAIIVWEDYRSGTYPHIYAQRVDASGSIQWGTNGVDICTASTSQWYPQIIGDGSGGAIITWYDYRGTTKMLDIYAQRVDASGSVQWGTGGQPICTAYDRQEYPTITSDGSGGTIIAWNDYRYSTTTHCDIYAQRVNASGSIQWGKNGVAMCAASGDQDFPQIISDGSGGAIITWDEYNSATKSDIYAQRVSGSGSIQWGTNGVAICTASGGQYSPKITTDGSGGAIIAWYDYSSDITWYDIYAQRVSGSGSMQWGTYGVAICMAGGDQESPKITTDGSGGAIIAWTDYRNSSEYPDIYAQQIGKDGTLGKTHRSLPFLPLLLLE